jgi:uncharacterized protein (TIGR00730 family)
MPGPTRARRPAPSRAGRISPVSAAAEPDPTVPRADQPLRRVCVYAGSRPGLRPEYARAAADLGGLLARRGIELVYGGGGVGLMGALADAAVAAGGRVIGVIPGHLAEREAAHRSLSELRVVATMHERKLAMSELSECFIALPGGTGTLEELVEMLTWAQLGLHRKPCGLLNVAGYYEPLIAFLDQAVGEGFLAAEDRAWLAVAASPQALLDELAKRLQDR